jgi:hypothetical protein
VPPVIRKMDDLLVLLFLLRHSVVSKTELIRFRSATRGNVINTNQMCF